MPAETDKRHALRAMQALPESATILPLDTTAEAYRLQGDIYRRMGGAARLSIAFQLTETVRRLALAGIRARHPDYSDQQLFQAWARLKLGDDIVRAIWPNCCLVDP